MTDISVSLYLTIFRIHKKITNKLINFLYNLKLAFETFWLSVLSNDMLEAIAVGQYSRSDKSNKYATYDYNRKGLFEWESEAIDKYFKHCKTIMVLAAGGGREVYALLQKGFKAEGFECNPELVQFANIFLAVLLYCYLIGF